MTSKRGPIQCFGAGQGASAAGGSLESGRATEAGAEFYGSWFIEIGRVHGGYKRTYNRHHPAGFWIFYALCPRSLLGYACLVMWICRNLIQPEDETHIGCNLLRVKAVEPGRHGTGD